MLIAAFIGFLGGQAIFTEHHVNVALSAPHAPCALIFGAVLFMTATGALCIALGTIVRRTAGGIALFVGVFFVLPGLIEVAAVEHRQRDPPVPAIQRQRRDRAGAPRLHTCSHPGAGSPCSAATPR